MEPLHTALEPQRDEVNTLQIRDTYCSTTLGKGTIWHANNAADRGQTLNQPSCGSHHPPCSLHHLHNSALLHPHTAFLRKAEIVYDRHGGAREGWALLPTALDTPWTQVWELLKQLQIQVRLGQRNSRPAKELKSVIDPWWIRKMFLLGVTRLYNKTHRKRENHIVWNTLKYTFHI